MDIYLEHSNMTVDNIDDAVAFLTTALPGFRILGRGHFTHEEWGVVNWLHLGNEVIYVCLNTPSNPHTSDRVAMRDIGVNHVGFVVGDIQAAVDRLTAAGYKGTPVMQDDPHRLNAYFTTNDGNQFEFVQYLSDDLSKRQTY